MRTTIHVDDQILKHVLKETGAKTLTQAIRGALEAFLAQRQRARLIKSFGSFPDWNPDIRALRKNRDLG